MRLDGFSWRRRFEWGAVMGGPGGVLVGRGVELSVFDELVAALVGGQGAVAWVEGEPGIGKSALIGAVVERALAAGCVTLVGRGDETGRVFPLRLMTDCLRGAMAAGRPGVAGSGLSSRLALFDLDAADPVWATGERMLAAVDRLCADVPVVLVAEDLQWADEWSLGLWTRLARSVDQIPLLLVGTSRPVRDQAVLARVRLMVQDGAGTAVDVEPLGGGDVAAMAAALTDASVGPRLQAVLAQSGGNPLYVREMLEALLRDGSVRVESRVAELVGQVEVLPESLVASIGRRLNFLSPPTYRALHMAALLGAEFGAGEWATVTGHTPGQLSEIVDEALTAGVLSSGGRGLLFRHELIRQVLTERTPAAMRRELHRAMARGLAAAGHDADVVAAQLLAVPGLDGWALDWLAQRSEAMVLSAPEVAADLLERAVGLLDEADPLWEVLATRLAEVRYRLGRDEAAGELAERVVAHTGDGEVAGRMRVVSIRAAGRSNRFELALARGEAAAADARLPARWRARSLAWSANVLLFLGRPDQPQARALQALEAAQECGDPLGGGYARLVLYQADPATQAFRLDEALASLGDDPESQDLRVLLFSKQLTDLADRGRWGEYDKVLARALVAAERVGAARATWIPQATVDTCYLRGDWDEALRQVAAIPPQFLDHPTMSNPRAVAAEIGLRRENGDLAAEHLSWADALKDDVHAGSAYAVVCWSEVLALKAEAGGDLAHALALRKSLLDQPELMLRGELFEFPNLVRVALQVDDSETAAAAVAASKKAAEGTGQKIQVLVARLSQAQLADDTVELLAVADRFAEYGSPPLQALALEEAACRLARQGDHPAARTALNEAVRIYDDLGATWDIKRADTRLRGYGVRRGPRSLHRRATHGWESLTPTQLRIAELVAKGMSNPDIATQMFVSRSTVQTHVSSILTKLDMRSRTQLILHHSSRS
jgi:DNA-binding CsgD family transcriptional regulator